MVGICVYWLQQSSPSKDSRIWKPKGPSDWPADCQARARRKHQDDGSCWNASIYRLNRTSWHNFRGPGIVVPSVHETLLSPRVQTGGLCLASSFSMTLSGQMFCRLMAVQQFSLCTGIALEEGTTMRMVSWGQQRHHPMSDTRSGQPAFAAVNIVIR